MVVRSAFNLELLVDDKPSTVIAGAAYKASLRVSNKGNSPRTVIFRIAGTPDYPAKIEPQSIALEAGTSQTIRVEVKTDEKLNQKVTHVLAVKAETQDAQGRPVSLNHSVAVDVLPRITGELDPYHRIPAYARIIGVAENGKTGLQAEISGSGTLDEEGKRRLEFLFRGPDTQAKSIYGLRDEYWLSYADTRLNFQAGDKSYGLSPLTEAFRYGRGVAVNLNPRDIGVGGYYMETRFTEPKEREAGAYAKFQLTDWLGLKGNFLNKNTDATSQTEEHEGKHKDNLYSIEALINPNAKTSIGLEYAMGQSDRDKKTTDAAYRATLKGQLGEGSSYSFEKIYAGPNFFGYYNDVDFTTGSITSPIYRNLRGDFAFRINKYNLDLDPSKNTATKETAYMPGVSYNFPWGTNISLRYEDFSREDRFSPATFNFEEKGFKLGLGQVFSILGVQLFAERWALQDQLHSKEYSDLTRYSIFANINPPNWPSINMYASWGPERYTGSPDTKKSFGFGTSWRKKSFDVFVAYQKNNFDAGKGVSQDNLLATINYTLPFRHIISFRGRWYRDNQPGSVSGSGPDSSSVSGSGSSYLLSYTIPFGIPVSRKKSIGALEGRIYDGEKSGKPPISDAILTAGGETAVTNRKGEFIFPALKPGEYYLGVDSRSIGLNRVTSEILPLKVEVKKGETRKVEIAAVTGCKIFGRVVIFAPDEADKTVLKEVRGLQETVVEITDGTETMRRFTDVQGRFSFTEVRPGKWTVKIYDNALPVHHYIEKNMFQVELKPGEEEEILAKVLQKLRTIQMIEEGVIKGAPTPPK